MVDGHLYDLQYSEMTVPPQYGKLRMWRNTDIPGLASSGTTKQITNGGCNCLLGNEWDEDLDNGFRPPGVMDLSSTTSQLESQDPGAGLVQNYGTAYKNGTAIHHLTLYRHSSGALIFDAGTVNWAWGLDRNHDYPADPSNEVSAAPTSEVDIQQGTVNLFADMGAQPQTIQSGLTKATASADKTAPGSVIQSPGSGANVTIASTVTVSGTATDGGGGVVAGIEVSVDGGTTWHPAGRIRSAHPCEKRSYIFPRPVAGNINPTVAPSGTQAGYYVAG